MTLDYACRQCGLCETRTQVVGSRGPAKSLLMFVGEAPGYHEDRDGKPFVGASGKCLEHYTKQAGIDIGSVYITNVVKCRPPDNRKPENEEIEACSQYLVDEILAVRPKLIVAFGATAAAFFLGKDPEEVRITKIRGSLLQWQHEGFTASVLFSNHPSYVLRQNSPTSEVVNFFVADLSSAKSLVYSDTHRLPSNTGKRVRSEYCPEISFINGYHVGERVHLHYRDSDDRLRIHVVDHEKYPYYFLIREEDITPKAKETIGQVMKRGVEYRGRMYRVRKLKRDPEIPSWIRVYPTVNDNWVSKQFKLGMPDEIARTYTTVSAALPIAKYFEIVGIRTFEADLDPLGRFLADHKVRLIPPKRLLYIDIETDDSRSGETALNELIGNVPILSIGAQDQDGKKFYVTSQRNDRDGERSLLREFLGWLESYDMLFAWNGDNFDYPFLWKRLREHGLEVKFYKWIWWDTMVSFKKHHFWDAEAKTGFSLDNVSKSILGEGKVERHSRIIDLYNSEPGKLREYNMGDVDRLARIEAKTGYSNTDAMLSALSNCFASNTYVSKRVDGLCLVEGYQRGTHFRTKEIPDINEEDGQYTGAFVLEPETGLFEGVSNFDFSSLYPSMFQTFNISPDTYIPRDEVSSLPSESLTVCPSFELGGVKRGGTAFISDPVGVIPTVYTVVAERRSYYKKKMTEVEAHSDEWYDIKRHEYAYKQLGLSIYGCLGSIYSRYYNRDVAEAITLSAQYCIRITMALARRLGYRPIYGDTDSLFIEIPEHDVDKFLDKCKAVYSRIGRTHNCKTNTISLKYEQRFSRIVIIRKKRYFGRVTSQQGVVTDAVDIRGLEVRRSDGVAYARRVQQALIDGILKHNWTSDQAKATLLKVKAKVFNQALGPDDLQVTVGLQRHPDKYKTAGPHVQIARSMIANGQEIYIGSKISYIVIDGKKSPIKTVSVDEFDGAYDPYYYWTKKIYPPVERILKVVWKDDDWSVFKVKRPRAARVTAK